MANVIRQDMTIDYRQKRETESLRWLSGILGTRKQHTLAVKTICLLMVLFIMGGMMSEVWAVA